MNFRHSVTNRAAEKAALIIYIFGRMVLRLRLPEDRLVYSVAKDRGVFQLSVFVFGQVFYASGF